MEIIDIITPRISFLWEVGLPFVIALTILVFVHEMGHYSVARFCDVRVEVFSIGLVQKYLVGMIKLIPDGKYA